MTSFRFMKDIFGGGVAPYVRLIKTRKTWESWQPAVCKFLPIKHGETEDTWVTSKSRVYSFLVLCKNKY